MLNMQLCVNVSHYHYRTFGELINNKEEYVSTRAEQYCPLGITIITQSDIHDTEYFFFLL